MNNVLEIINVSKQFKRKSGNKERFYALRNVSLQIREGEIFAILGPNGAGKTTLMNIIMNLLYPDSGRVRIFGNNPGHRDVFSRMGYVSGDGRFHWSLTPIDILNVGGMLYGIKRKERTERIRELVRLFGLENVMRSKFDVLSTGERMKLAFAYALMHRPKLLLLDEPTLGLDPDAAINVRKEIKRINRELKTTIVLTSHYMHEVEQLARRIAFVNKGEVKDLGTLAAIKKKHPDLEDYFVKMVESGRNSEAGGKKTGK